MPYKEPWGEKAKERSKKRLEYFKNYRRKKLGRKFNGFGSRGELIALKYLKGSILVRNSGYDLLWGKIKIEVKISKLNKENSWFFNIGRQKNKTHYYFLIGTNKKMMILKMFLIPEKDIKNMYSIEIRDNSQKYKNYELKGSDES